MIVTNLYKMKIKFNSHGEEKRKEKNGKKERNEEKKEKIRFLSFNFFLGTLIFLLVFISFFSEQIHTTEISETAPESFTLHESTKFEYLNGRKYKIGEITYVFTDEIKECGLAYENQKKVVMNVKCLDSLASLLQLCNHETLHIYLDAGEKEEKYVDWVERAFWFDECVQLLDEVAFNVTKTC